MACQSLAFDGLSGEAGLGTVAGRGSRSRAAALVYNKQRMRRKLDKTISAISRRLERESFKSLARTMPFPDRWDPFFMPTMTLTDVYAYPTLH